MENQTDGIKKPRISLNTSKLLRLGGVPADAESSLKLSKPVGGTVMVGKPGD